MARALTQAQVIRRKAILARLAAFPNSTADALREHLARRCNIYITVDTVQRDLRVMKKIGTVRSVGRSYYEGLRWELCGDTEMWKEQPS